MLYWQAFSKFFVNKVFYGAKASHLKLTLLWLPIAILSRLLPHLPNTTPFITLSLWASLLFPQRIGVILLLLALIISDTILAFWQHYPIIGAWTFFNYTGFLFILRIGFYFSSKLRRTTYLWIACLAASFGFWLWTNLGVWLTSHLYPLTWQGFVTCYVMALPFLRNACIGSFIPLFLLLLMRNFLLPLSGLDNKLLVKSSILSPGKSQSATRSLHL